MNPPAIVIRLPLEGRPAVYTDTVDDEEAARLDWWLATRPEYAELVEEALRLAAEASAA